MHQKINEEIIIYVILCVTVGTLRIPIEEQCKLNDTTHGYNYLTHEIKKRINRASQSLIRSAT